MKKWFFGLIMIFMALAVVMPGIAMAKHSKVDKNSSQTSEAATKKGKNPHGSSASKQTSTTHFAQAKTFSKKHRSKHAASDRPAAKNPSEPGSFSREYASQLFVRAKAALLMDMNTGEILYSLNPDESIAPASLTKLLTLYLIREALQQNKIGPNELIPVSQQASHTSGSRMSLRSGEMAPLDELIKGISVVSANDACEAVAEYFGQGDPQAFIARMNDKAQLLGMTHSTFKTPNGLPAPGQYTTARDILMLSTDYLHRFPEALAIHSLPNYTHNNRTHTNSNTLLGKFPGVDGLKTGFVCESGYNIVATAKRGDTRLLAVVLGSPSKGVRERETEKLLDRGFAMVADNTGSHRTQLAYHKD
ncbi:MAG: D-alanyl-D-alanine carboxypeptidase [Desulfovibrionaceae bacterium]|nr:D-alanyl-D-alanine carboxypeptidase [Desulfovibrionaceae bacterium]MBF0513209.1 D-alanyl-D-alanine carboxypeptidase [Desulfovibrionaceae bacterium]